MGMPRRMIWHDMRLRGRTPFIDDANNYEVDDYHTLDASVSYIVDYAKDVNGLYRLDILCHGLYDWVEDDSTQQSQEVGGFGLKLTGTNLTYFTADKLSRLAGLVDTIVIYACGTSNTNASVAGTNSAPNLGAGDGRALVKRIVEYTQAYVVASDFMQMYFLDPISFGNWEGNVNGFDIYDGVTPWGLTDWKLE